MSQEKTATMPPQENTISLEEATYRTTQWRSFFKSLDPKGRVSIPKAIFISKEDLQELLDNYSQVHGDSFSGVRLYLTIDPIKTNPDIGLYPVAGALVPTVTVTDSSGVTYNEDVIMEVPIVPPGNSVGIDPEMGWSIYDFTQPCPALCIGTSPELTGG